MNAKNKFLAGMIILILSVIAFYLMYYSIGWTLKKSLIISSGAGLGMVIFDVLLRKGKPAE